MIASRSSNSTSNTPPLASKQEENRIVSCMPRNSLRCFSSWVCRVCVPQMNRTDAIPKPQVSSAYFAAASTVGWSARPR